ncbi:MAG TPA: beta-galactosidase GalA [Lacunisphaera sp.]|nr:beta-galactosidase GalA [Lacunisphaera sp.]
MNIARSLRPAFLGALALALGASFAAAAAPRQHLLLDRGWKFHLGDDWPGALRLDKAGVGAGPASADGFADISWRDVDLPHDWAIELPFDRNADLSHGFKALGPGYERNSVGWYRRKFELPAADAGQRIWLTFDGVFRDATVWVNGWLVRHHEGGYYPFREDITDVVKFGGANVVAVRVDASRFEGWFYEGAGIYRHVWLDETAPVALAPDGLFVRSAFKDNVPAGPAAVLVDADLLNTLTTDVDAVVTAEIIAPDGTSVAHFDGAQHVAGGTRATCRLQAPLAAPVLWSPESPRLYTLVTTVAVQGRTVDHQETTFGIRTVAFDPERGFLLNGRHYEIHGTCNHQDHAGVGAAIPDALQAFRLEQLKKFGCNAIRTSHNPPTPELLDACDRLGFLVMDENRLLGSDSLNLRKWDEFIRRDRNHPSVAIWSISNEEFTVQATAQGGNVARTMQDYVRRLDPTRPVTYPAPEGDSAFGINGVIEVRGWNYHPGPDMDTYHAKHPAQPNVGTEQGSTTGTRGIYESDPAAGHVAAYDEPPHRWVTSAETWWSWFADRPWLSGGFVWTGFDYRGEPTPYGWPCISSHFGVLDTCGFPKDNFYYYKAWWTDEVVLHLLPHWTWPGRDGHVFRVDALSNCREVELFLNGTSLGRKKMKPNSKLTWQVAYAPGVLAAKGYDAGGKVIAETKVETTGAATRLRLTPDRPSVRADGEDVAVFTVEALDAAGRVVPVAQNLVRFALAGGGRIIGVGNGDPSCHEPDTFIPTLPVRRVELNRWRWKQVAVTPGDAAWPEYAAGFDDAGWASLDGANANWPRTIAADDATAIYRAQLQLTDDDLKGPGVQIQFNGCDDEGWYFVNGRLVGETHEWNATPAFDITRYLHAGDNVVAVCCRNGGGQGGLNPAVTVEIAGRAGPVAWSRSLFNGLAQVIVQSAPGAGEFTLTARAEGLEAATATVRTLPSPLRPSVP